MLHNAWFTWPKMLAAYYLILALHFYLQSLRHCPADPARGAGYFVAFAVGSLLAFLTHQVAVVYVVPLLLHAGVMGLRNRAYRPLLATLPACALIALALVGPWYAWLAGTLGKDKITGSTPVTLGDDKATFSPLAVAKWMGFNVSVSVVPVGIGQAFLTEVAADAEPPRWSVEVAGGDPRWFLGPPNLVELHRGFTQLYFSLLTGAVTLSLCAFLVGARRGAATARPRPARDERTAQRPRRVGRRLALPAWRHSRGGLPASG